MTTPSHDRWSRRALLRAAVSASASLVLAPLPAAAAPPLRLRDSDAQRILNEALTDEVWWKGASVERFSGKQYDEIRLRRLSHGGYLTYVSGEGAEDFAHEDVARTVWDHQDKLENHFDGVIVSTTLGTGRDPQTGTEYRDRFMLLDFGLFYARQVQRMYRYPLPDGRTLLAFECLTPAFTDAATWRRYLAIRDRAEQQARARGDLRSVFGSIVDIDILFGVFIVEPGQVHTTRISLVAEIGFTSDNSWLGSVGSKIPPVIKSGLRGGFDASVSVCRAVKAGTYR